MTFYTTNQRCHKLSWRWRWLRWLKHCKILSILCTHEFVMVFCGEAFYLNQMHWIKSNVKYMQTYMHNYIYLSHKWKWLLSIDSIYLKCFHHHLKFPLKTFKLRQLFDNFLTTKICKKKRSVSLILGRIHYF